MYRCGIHMLRRVVGTGVYLFEIAPCHLGVLCAARLLTSHAAPETIVLQIERVRSGTDLRLPEGWVDAGCHS